MGHVPATITGDNSFSIEIVKFELCYCVLIGPSWKEFNCVAYALISFVAGTGHDKPINHEGFQPLQFWKNLCI